VNSDTRYTATSGKPALTTTATAQSPPGSYQIKISTGTLASAKYSFKYEDGWLTVAK
jgi:hypothetical protein